MANEILEKLKSGELPPPVVGLIAKGAFPLPPPVRVEALVCLLQDASPEIRDTAAQTLESTPEGMVQELLASPDVDPGILYFFADLAERAHKPQYFDAIVQNAATADDFIAFLASRLPPNILDIIATNQMRLIRSPQIMDAIELNPRASRDVLRRVREVREEFFVKKRAPEPSSGIHAGTSPAAPSPAQQAPDESAPAALVKYGEKRAVLAGKTIAGEALAKVLPKEIYDTLEPEEKAEGLTPERVSVFQKIFKMNVPERVQLAIKGTREERSILIRDSSRLVVDTLLRSPKMTEQEIETFSAMRSMSEENLKRIAMNRDWIKNYKILLNLVNNPKTPIPTALSFLARIHEKDVYSLSRSKNVPDVIRKAAARLVDKRRDRAG